MLGSNLDILGILQYVKYAKYVAICHNIPNYILSIFEHIFFLSYSAYFFVIFCIFFVIFCKFSGIFSGIFRILKQISQGQFLQCSAN
jgi:hypothetical protein